MAYDYNGYGGMAYYSSVDCGFASGSNNTTTGCTTDYAQSEVKYVVDAWKNAKSSVASEARLITKDEYANLCNTETYETPTEPGVKFVPQYDWMYSNSFQYITMTPFGDSTQLWNIGYSGNMDPSYSVMGFSIVRPVIVLPKSAL